MPFLQIALFCKLPVLRCLFACCLLRLCLFAYCLSALCLFACCLFALCLFACCLLVWCLLLWCLFLAWYLYESGFVVFLPFSVVFFFFTNFDSVCFRLDLTLFTFRLLNFVIDIPLYTSAKMSANFIQFLLSSSATSEFYWRETSDSPNVCLLRYLFE